MCNSVVEVFQLAASNYVLHVLDTSGIISKTSTLLEGKWCSPGLFLYCPLFCYEFHSLHDSNSLSILCNINVIFIYIYIYIHTHTHTHTHTHCYEFHNLHDSNSCNINVILIYITFMLHKILNELLSCKLWNS